MKTVKPTSPTKELLFQQSVKPKRNTKKTEDHEVHRLLLQVIAEAKTFRPDKQEGPGDADSSALQGSAGTLGGLATWCRI
jgi:hypothetical protein